MRAVLDGDRWHPRLLLQFPQHQKLPRGVHLPKYPYRAPVRGRQAHRGRPDTVMQWVQQLPSRRWDPTTRMWVVMDPGPDADRVFREVGFEVDLSRAAAAGVTCLADLAHPLFFPDDTDQYVTWMYPRFSTGTVVLPTGVWDRGRGAFAVHTPDLGSDEFAHLLVGDALQNVARTLRATPVFGGDGPDDAVAVAATMALQVDGDHAVWDRLGDVWGVLPDWFIWDLFPFQLNGVYALLGGHSALCDPPGLGKTAQAIAAHVLAGTERLVVVCPTKVRSTWARHFEAMNVAYRDTFTGVRRDGAGGVVVVQSGRKLGELPDRGVVVVGDAMLAANTATREAILGWNPDGLVVDEVHRQKGWDKGRSVAVRRVANQVTGLKVPMSGTPMFQSPSELVAMLAISGHLDTTFGGLTAFLTRYCVQDLHGNWKARKSMLGELRQVLDTKVWVRRDKTVAMEQIANHTRGRFPHLTFLPPRPYFVDVDLGLFTAAHKDVNDRIDEWLDTLSGPPSVGERDVWVADQIGLISLLRRAAGLSKVPAAVEYIQDWVNGCRPGDGGVWDDPLIVWTHHRDVTEAMIAAVEAVDAPVAALWGGSNDTKTEQVEADFQAGKYAVLVASIHAAGAGITLTRARHALWVETDWTPALQQQSADRNRRIGQTRDVDLMVMVAEGTLDERIQATLAGKAQVLDPVLGVGNNVAVVESADGSVTAKDILCELVDVQVARRFR